MRRSDFNYPLPQELIAQRPLAQRAASRMLCLDKSSGAVRDLAIRDLAGLLEAGDLLVLNDTRVLPARLHGHKASGGRVEIFLERILASGRFSAKIRASKTPKPGTQLRVGEYDLTVTGREGELFLLQTEADISELIEQHGHIPLPPYIDRPDDISDKTRYQTIWARHEGAVAAPTAGLHFDDALLDTLRERGVNIGYVTLHVGSGTYARVRDEDLTQHRLHAEKTSVSQALCDQVANAKAAGRRVVAVGTTVVRSLESVAMRGRLAPYAGETDIFITPGYRFQIVDALLTNFHEPESTLMMLVCAFAGRENLLAAYDHAVENKYRFLSYGDAMFIA